MRIGRIRMARWGQAWPRAWRGWSIAYLGKRKLNLELHYEGGHMPVDPRAWEGVAISKYPEDDLKDDYAFSVEMVGGCQAYGDCPCNAEYPAEFEEAYTPRHPSSQRFVDRIMSLIDLHDKKQADYGSDTDPFANVREGARELGLPGWVGSVIRMNDKIRRLNKAAKQYIETGEISLANEGVLDSFDDLAVYSGIGATLFEEESTSTGGKRDE